MARRSLDIHGQRWEVYPSGRLTAYDRDEFGLVFEHGTGPDRIRRVTRFSPLGTRRWDLALAELSDVRLHELFAQSQPAWTSPETGYARRAG
jgi:hypothetical protein